MKPTIKPCHAYGPKVGRWNSHGTVAETIARELKRLKALADLQATADAEAASKTVQIKRKERT